MDLAFVSKSTERVINEAASTSASLTPLIDPLIFITVVILLIAGAVVVCHHAIWLIQRYYSSDKYTYLGTWRQMFADGLFDGSGTIRVVSETETLIDMVRTLRLLLVTWLALLACDIVLVLAVVLLSN